MKRIALAASVALVAVLAACSGGAASPAPAPPAAPSAGATYVCPMACVRPGESSPHTQAQPGDCPVCGMALHEAPAAAPAAR